METFLVFKVSFLYLRHNSCLKFSIMATKWTLNADQSDVLIKTKQETLTYLGGNTNQFNGFLALEEDQIQDASLEFLLDNNAIVSQKRIATKKTADSI